MLCVSQVTLAMPWWYTAKQSFDTPVARLPVACVYAWRGGAKLYGTLITKYVCCKTCLCSALFMFVQVWGHAGRTRVLQDAVVQPRCF